MHPAIDADLLARAANELDALRSTVGRMTAGPWIVNSPEQGERWELSSGATIDAPDHDWVCGWHGKGDPLDRDEEHEQDVANARAVVALRNAADHLIAIARAALAVKEAQAVNPNNDPVGWSVEVHRKVADLDAALAQFGEP